MFSILPFLLSYWTIYRCLYLSTRFMLSNVLLHSVSWMKFSWDRWLLLRYVCDFVLLQSGDISLADKFIIYFWDHSNSKAQLTYFLCHRTHLISSTCKKPSSGLFLCASLIIFIIIIHFRNSLKKATNHLCSAYRYTYIYISSSTASFCCTRWLIVERLQVADNSALYGCCVLVEEIVQRPSKLVSMLMNDKPVFPRRSRYVITTPRCYCILSRLPFFELHFGVLQRYLFFCEIIILLSYWLTVFIVSEFWHLYKHLICVYI